MVRPLESRSDEIEYLIIVDAFHGDYVDFDGVKPHSLRPFYAFPHLVEEISSGDAVKTASFEGVHAHIYVAYPAVPEIAGKLFQQDTVGREGYALQTIDLVEPFDKPDDSLPNQGFSPGQSYLSDTPVDT